MKNKEDLRRLLTGIDHKGYKAYKSLEGIYAFGAYDLAIDHVQGDPFAPPSRVRLIYKNPGNIPEKYFNTRARRMAAEDYLLRRLHKSIRSLTSGGRRGTGSSGRISICHAGQEVLERTAVLISKNTIEVRLEVGFPAYGRTIAAGELEEILFTLLPDIARRSLAISRELEAGLTRAVELGEDQEFIRQELKRLGLVSFVADGSILPRESGISQYPMKSAVPFTSPDSLAVTLELPHRGSLRGMGIGKGVTVIVGGGYHGKSTLLKAIERGVYNHIQGDGREYIITDETAFKLRAEEGRCIPKEDISLFINHLPSKTDTTAFTTENASGSTSQAANTVEALACGSRVLLIDEDTSATNFMVRDSLMAQLVADEQEPITPFIRRVRGLYDTYDISTVLVVGSSGAYLSVADTVIQMDCYVAKDVTQRAKALAEENTYDADINGATQGDRPLASALKHRVKKRSTGKLRVHGWDTLSLDKMDIDLRYLEQIVDETQTAALGYIMQYILENIADGIKTPPQLAREATVKLSRDGLVSMVPKGYSAGAPAAVREQEILAGLVRYRQL